MNKVTEEGINMSKEDLKFKTDNFDFHSRASVIIYNKDKSKVLLFKVEDERDFYLLPGGKIHINEDSLSAIKREVKEELGYDLEFTFSSINENFLIKENTKIMQYEFLYKAIYHGPIEKEIFNCLDRENQTFHWISIKDIDKVKILPSNLTQIIKNYDYNQIHSILKNIE